MMVRFWLVLFIFFTSARLEKAMAEAYQREVSFEWEAIEGAKYYEVELTLAPPEPESNSDSVSGPQSATEMDSETEDEKAISDDADVRQNSNSESKTSELLNPKSNSSSNRQIFKTTIASWVGYLAPNRYLMRIRSHDRRNVPGEWSQPQEFNVGLEAAKLASPANAAKINSNSETSQEISFAWSPVGGATLYHFEIQSEDNSTHLEMDIKKSNLKLNLAVANRYTWKVSSSNTSGTPCDATSSSQFTLIGKQIETPKITNTESSFVREIKWSQPAGATHFDVLIYKKSTAQGPYEKFKIFKNYQKNILPFATEWSGGRYRISVRAKSKLRPNSKTAKASFSVNSGDRSPAAEYTALLRSAIDHAHGWYAIGSYLITTMKFQGRNPESNSMLSYEALGGTGRLGIGWFIKNRPWGFLTIADLSGFTVNGKTHVFTTLESNAVYKQNFGSLGEIRYQMGPYFKELPETIGDPFSGSSVTQTIRAAGGHLGAELWYSMTPKFGIQVNTHLYTSLVKISTPNDQPLEPNLSTQFGFLGSYKVNSHFTGFAGYAHREDKLSYKAIPNSGNFANAGDVNESTITGDYLNLFAEWSF